MLRGTCSNRETSYNLGNSEYKDAMSSIPGRPMLVMTLHNMPGF